MFATLSLFVELAETTNYKTGKWTVLLGDSVDSDWQKITRSIVNDQLGISAKVTFPKHMGPYIAPLACNSKIATA